MSVISISGAHGFLGWHTRVAIDENGSRSSAIQLGERFDLETAVQSVEGTERYIHLAGVNRGSEADVLGGNVAFAEQAAEAILRSEVRPKSVVFANSTQAGNATPYGEAKLQAAEILRRVAEKTGVAFYNVLLPNLFGEHGKPHYNSVASTFCHVLAEGGEPEVQVDKELTLLHAQDAADLLLDPDPFATSVLTEHDTVSGLLNRLRTISFTYSRGEIPDIDSRFDRSLFNTYRSYAFAIRPTINLDRHSDLRGSFFEVLRSHGGKGQSSFSTTKPGVTRGDHYHRRKVERFVVLAGSATIALRRLFHSQVYRFEVTGEAPVALDMPTMWSHNITNTGQQDLYTCFWTDDLFNPEAPDTRAEAVEI